MCVCVCVCVFSDNKYINNYICTHMSDDAIRNILHSMYIRIHIHDSTGGYIQ